MKHYIYELFKLMTFGVMISGGAILAYAILYTKITGYSSITFSFNVIGEHTIEAIIFPIMAIVSLVLLFIEANKLGNEIHTYKKNKNG